MKQTHISSHFESNIESNFEYHAESSSCVPLIFWHRPSKMCRAWKSFVAKLDGFEKVPWGVLQKETAKLNSLKSSTFGYFRYFDISSISTSSSCLSPWIFPCPHWKKRRTWANSVNLTIAKRSFHLPKLSSRRCSPQNNYMKNLEQTATCHSEHGEDWGSACHVGSRPSHCSRCRYKLQKLHQCLTEIHANCHVDSFKSLVIWFKDRSKFQGFCSRWDRSSPEPLKSSKANFSKQKSLLNVFAKHSGPRGHFPAGTWLSTTVWFTAGLVNFAICNFPVICTAINPDKV